MGTFVAIYQNYADAAVLSGGSYQSSLPLDNVKDLDIGRVARTTNTDTSSAVVIADLGASRFVGGVVIGPTNLSPGSTYRIRASSLSDFSTLVYDSGVQTVAGSTMDWSNTANWLQWEDPGFWFGIPDVFDLALVPVWAASILPSNAFARFWKIEFFDSLNADGYIQFGRLIIGRAWRPTANYAFGGEFSCEPIYRRVEAIGGRRTDWDLNRRRGLRLTFELRPEADLFDDVFRMRQYTGASKQIWVSPDPEDNANFQKRSFLATFKTPPPIVQSEYGYGTTVIDCDEVL